MIKNRINKLHDKFKYRIMEENSLHNLTDDELLKLYLDATNKIYQQIKKSDKKEAEEYKKLFIDNEEVLSQPYHPSVNCSLSREERIEIWAKRREWELDETKDPQMRRRILDLYEVHIDIEQTK